MVGFYKHDIPAWMDGTESLSDAAYRAYHVVVQLIMLNEGPIARNDRGIAGRCNMTVKAFQRALTELVAAGKLTAEGDRIRNARADRELASVMENRENAGKGGKTRAERAKTQKNPDDRAAKSLQNNEGGLATLETLPSLKEKRREDTPVVPKGTLQAEFAEWWDLYPKRRGTNSRAAAEELYVRHRQAGVEREVLFAAVKSYGAECRRADKVGTEMVKQAESFLSARKRLWEDYAAKVTPQPATPAAPAAPAANDAAQPAHPYAHWPEDRWRDAVKIWRNTCGHWPWTRSAAPDSPNTMVPRHILAELNIHPAAARAA